jgi:FkbM family methyltransferase
LTRAKTFINEKFPQYRVHLFQETAAWIYDGTIDFYLDTINKANNFWGSSLNKNHPDVIKSGSNTKVTVKCVDIARIVRKYRESDFLVIKVDIEGAEYDLLFDFLNKAVFKLIDHIAVEFHPNASNSKYIKYEQVFLQIMELFGTKFFRWP